MKAAQFGQFGGPEVLEIVDLPDPQAGPGEIRIAVHAAGINATDWKVRKGLLGGDLPQTTPKLGFAEAAGLPVALETATRSLDALGVAAGQTLLVSGAAGGIGSAAVQLAVARGARVIGTASPVRGRLVLLVR